MAPVEPPSTATVLAGRYRLERRVAQGGMAEVWLGTDLSLNRQVAVKLLKPHLASDPVIAERFRREAIAVASVNHTNIVQVFDAVADGDRQAVVMQYVDGKTLRRLLDEQKQLSPELTVHIGMALAGALDAAHSAGLVHRDVKPGNVMVTPDGKVLLTDFGIAKALGGGDDLTSDNVMMGTAKYLSPEQVRGRRLDGRADLYSLGLVLYECLAGKVPFQGETDADTALARLQRDPTDLMRLRPTLPGGLVDVITKLVQREPDNRFTTGAEVRAALSKALATPEPSIEMPGTPAQSPTPVATPPPSTKVARPTGRSDRTPSSSHYPRAPRDRTPPTPRRRPPPPKMQQQWKPSLVVVGGLLVLAIVMVIVLWAAARTQGDGGDGTDTTAPSGGVATVTEMTVYDPDGDGSETADNAPEFDADGALTKPWQTHCYKTADIAHKDEIGLVLNLSAPSTGTLSALIDTGPWTASVYAVDVAAPLADEGLAAWGPPIITETGAADERLEVPVENLALNLLLVFTQIGEGGDSCTNPSFTYRARITQLTFTAA
jgi:eukaryotic-like serine/threonine-protein kinase